MTCFGFLQHSSKQLTLTPGSAGVELKRLQLRLHVESEVLHDFHKFRTYC